MENIRVCVVYFPWIYTDIFQRVFRRFEHVTIIENYFHDLYPEVKKKTGWEYADIMILSLDTRNTPELNLLPQQMSQALFVAFSPQGDYGMQRRPNESDWEEVRPFGFEQLLQLVQESYKGCAQAQLTRNVNLEDAAE